jgi:hypothetical protein
LIFITAASFTCGYFLLRLFRIDNLPPSLLPVLTISCGMGILSTFLFLLGHLYLFSPDILISLGIITALPFPFVLKSCLKSIKRDHFSSNLNRFSILCLTIDLSIILLYFITSFLPVTGGIRNDEICLHLSIPKEWLLAGKLGILPYPISYQAGNAHLLFALASCFSSQAGPHLLSWISFVLCGIAVYAVTREFSNKNTAIIAATFVFTNPLIFRGSDIAFTDLLSILFIIAPVSLLLIFRSKQKIQCLIIAAFLMGIGCGIKTTDFLYSFILIITFSVFEIFDRKDFLIIVKNFAVLTGITALCALPWPVRNLLLTGSPLYPPPLFLYHYFDLKPLLHITVPFTISDVSEYYNYCLSRYGDYHRNLLNFLRFPLDITMSSEKFQIGDSIGTILLSFSPLLVTFPKMPKSLLYIFLSAAASSMLIYFILLPEARYFMTAYMLMCPALAYVISKANGYKNLEKVIKIIIVLNLAFSLAIAIRISYPKTKAIFNSKVRAEYLQKNTPFYELYGFLGSKKISTVGVLYPSQIFYYLPCRYTVINDINKYAEQNGEYYLLDIDYSQTPCRDILHAGNQFSLKQIPMNSDKIFESKDAILYHIKQR